MDHKTLDSARSQAVPHVSMDYAFYGHEDEQTIPTLVLRDHESRTTPAHGVPAKGAGEWSVLQTAFAISQLGHS